MQRDFYLIIILLGMPMSKYYSHLSQTLPGDITTSGNLSFDDDRTTTISTSFDSAPSPQSISSQFVPNAVGLGQRSASKRNTFKRTTRVDGSTDDLLHYQQQQQQISGHHPQQQQQQQQQQQHEYHNPSSNYYTPQHIPHPSGLRPNTPSYMHGPNTSNTSNIRHNLTHGAHDYRNSSGHDSGLSSGGTSYDPEQHYMRQLGNPNYPLIPIPSNAQTVDPYDVPPPIPIPRRKSLPSIVKIKPGDYKIDETARSSDNLQEKETFIIENGIRKRVTEQAPTYTESGTPIPQATVMTSSTGSPTLARRIILESVTRVDAPTSTTSGTGGNKRGSMPTLVNVARKRQAAPSMFIKESIYMKLI
jgi:hypothetical protein